MRQILIESQETPLNQGAKHLFFEHGSSENWSTIVLECLSYRVNPQHDNLKRIVSK